MQKDAIITISLSLFRGGFILKILFDAIVLCCLLDGAVAYEILQSNTITILTFSVQHQLCISTADGTDSQVTHL